MVEPRFGRRGWKRGAAKFGEAPGKVQENFSGMRIAGGNRASRTGVATLEGHVADAEADHAALVFGEEAVFPESRQLFMRAPGLVGVSFDFERGAGPQARFLER